MPTAPRRHVLSLLGAGVGMMALPALSWAGDSWRGTLWIVGAGAFGEDVARAMVLVANLQARPVASASDATIAGGDVVLLQVSAPTGTPAQLATEIGNRVASIRERGAHPVLLGARVDGAAAEAWSIALTALADELGAPLIDRSALHLAVDAPRATAGPLGEASAVVRRLGLYFPLREYGARSVRMPVGLHSSACAKTMPAVAYVPDDVPKGGLPVLYLLHGAWGAFSDWSLAAHERLLDLAARHRVILVCPHGEPFGWYLDSPQVAESQIRTHLIDELVPHVDKTLPTNGRRSVGGLSMGGHGAVLLSLQHPGTFRSASSMSGAIDITHVPKSKQITRLLGPFSSNEAAWVAHSAARQLAAKVDLARTLPLRLTCGTADIWYQTNLELHERLQRLSVPHVWDATEGAGHTWAYWLAQLPEHVAWHAGHLHAPEAP